MLQKTSPYLNTHELLLLYNATFSSSLSYGCYVWGLTIRNILKKIKTLQKQYIQYKHVTLYNKIFKILKIKDSINVKNCLLVHDYINYKLPNSFRKSFTLQKEINNYNTWNSSKGSRFPNLINSEKDGRKSIKDKTILNWNNYTKCNPKMDVMKMNINRGWK